MIIIPIKWLFHWEYTLFSDKPICNRTDSECPGAKCSFQTGRSERTSFCGPICPNLGTSQGDWQEDAKSKPTALLIRAYAKLFITALCQWNNAAFFMRQAILCILPLTLWYTIQFKKQPALRTRSRITVVDRHVYRCIFSLLSQPQCGIVVLCLPPSCTVLSASLAWTFLAHIGSLDPFFLHTFLRLHHLCHRLLLRRDEMKFSFVLMSRLHHKVPERQSGNSHGESRVVEVNGRKRNTPISAMMLNCFCFWIWA